MKTVGISIIVLIILTLIIISVFKYMGIGKSNISGSIENSTGVIIDKQNNKFYMEDLGGGGI